MLTDFAKSVLLGMSRSDEVGSQGKVASAGWVSMGLLFFVSPESIRQGTQKC